MNHDDVIRMAQEAGLIDWAVYGRIESKEECLARFAELVKQHIQIEQMPKFEELAEIVRKDERERCAKICDEYERANLYGFKECAARIRDMI